MCPCRGHFARSSPVDAPGHGLPVPCGLCRVYVEGMSKAWPYEQRNTPARTPRLSTCSKGHPTSVQPHTGRPWLPFPEVLQLAKCWALRPMPGPLWDSGRQACPRRDQKPVTSCACRPGVTVARAGLGERCQVAADAPGEGAGVCAPAASAGPGAPASGTSPPTPPPVLPSGPAATLGLFSSPLVMFVN